MRCSGSLDAAGIPSVIFHLRIGGELVMLGIRGCARWDSSAAVADAFRAI
jgi:hypothetical protein